MKSKGKLFFIVVASFFIWSLLFYPSEYGRWWHLLSGSPSGLYDKTILVKGADFSFKKAHEFDLEFEYFNYYQVGILFRSNTFLSSFLDKGEQRYSFSGKILIELLNGKRVIKKEIVSAALSYTYGKGLDYYRGMSLYRFPVSLVGKYSGYKLRITVLEGDPMLTPENTTLYFSVSTAI